MTDKIVEADWTTAAGLRAICLLVRNSHRCGYVAVPEGHPLYGMDYQAADEKYGYFDVHGGLTYSTTPNTDAPGYPVESEGLWWFGFDCAHSGDGLLPGAYSVLLEAREGNPVRTEEYVRDECEKLARQFRLGRLKV